MAAQKERRRRRQCPSCGGDRIVRGGLVEGVRVMLAPQTEISEQLVSPVYSDTCGDCGMVMLFARVGGG
ncbi:MAG: hypothetical protein ACE149_06595 [Armatimonadota bacterium]